MNAGACNASHKRCTAIRNQRTQRFQAGLANWKPRNSNQGGVTNTAIGGKKRNKIDLQRHGLPNGENVPHGPAQAVSKASTAEDASRIRPRSLGALDRLSVGQYSRGLGRYATRVLALESLADWLPTRPAMAAGSSVGTLRIYKHDGNAFAPNRLQHQKREEYLFEDPR